MTSGDKTKIGIEARLSVSHCGAFLLPALVKHRQRPST